MNKIIIIIWAILIVLVLYTIFETYKFLKVEYATTLKYYNQKNKKFRDYTISRRNESLRNIVKNNFTKAMDTQQINKQIGYAMLSFQTNDTPIKDEKIYKDKISIGRANENDIILKDNTVSREQCLIIKMENKFIICDLSSTNKTLLNGLPVNNNCEIKYGDIVEIGKVKFRFNDVVGTI